MASTSATKASDFTISPQINTIYKGPLAVLEKNSDYDYSQTTIRFPEDLGISSDKAHYIIFHINLQQNSSYNSTAVFVPGVSGTANKNKSAAISTGLSQISSANTAVGGALQLTTTQAVLGGAAIGAIAGVKTAIQAGATNAAQVTAGGLAGGLAGGVGGALASVLLSKLDLTRKTKRVKTTIALYMPDTMQFRYSHDYNPLGMTEALGSLGLIQAFHSVTDSVEKTVGNLLGSSYGTGSGSAAVAEGAGKVAEATGLVGSGFQDAALFSAGYAMNPQYELMFRQTNLREFQFEFKFVPRNSNEKDAIQEIIRQFRFHAAPELAAGSTGRYLVPPSEFDIEFKFATADNRYVPKISTCVLENIDVNYSSAGQWTTFADGHPVEITMILTFKEVEMVTKQLVEQGY